MMARQKTIPIRERLRKLFPASWLTRTAKESGAFQRLRAVLPVPFFWTLVLGFGAGEVKTLAGLRRSYEKETRQSLAQSSFYDRFTASLVAWLKLALRRALEHSLGVGRALQGALKDFVDVLLTDSTVIRLHELLSDAFPACRVNHTKAALKAHFLLSVTGAGHQSVRLTAERAHDGPVLRLGPWVGACKVICARP